MDRCPGGTSVGAGERLGEYLLSPAAPAVGPPHIPPEHVPSTQVFPDGLNIRRLALVDETGLASNHGEFGYLRKSVDDVFRDPVTQKLLDRSPVRLVNGNTAMEYRSVGLSSRSEGVGKTCSTSPLRPLPQPLQPLRANPPSLTSYADPVGHEHAQARGHS